MREVDEAVRGEVRSGYEAVAAALGRALAERPATNAAVCVYVDGEPVVDIWTGPAYARDSLQVVWSSTKAAAALCIAVLVDRGQIELHAPVARYWPEFGAAGKARITVAQVLSHQSGLPVADGSHDADAWADGRVADVLAAQRPAWEPGTRHGYQVVTHGVLLDALVRRVDGRSLGRFFDEEIRRPLDLELWIGLPGELEPRVVPVVAPAEDAMGAPEELARALADPRSIQSRLATSSPWVVDPLTLNDPRMHALELPAANGIASARGLARLYAACLGEVDGCRIVSPETLGRFTASWARGNDAFSLVESHFGLGFQLPLPRLPMAGPGSFGHDGRGGSLGFGNADLGLAYGYVVDEMPANWLTGDPANAVLVDAVLGCLSGRTSGGHVAG